MQQQSKQNVYLHLGVISHDSFCSKFYRMSRTNPSGNWPACVFLMYSYHTRVFQFMLFFTLRGGARESFLWGVMMFLDLFLSGLLCNFSEDSSISLSTYDLYAGYPSAIEIYWNITFFIQENRTQQSMQIFFSINMNVLIASSVENSFYSFSMHSLYEKKK